MTEGRKKRGRPPLPVQHKITRVLMHRLTGVNALLEAMVQGRAEALLRSLKGGRPADQDLNQRLREAFAEAKRRGMKKRDGVKMFIEREPGREPGAATPDEVTRYERRLDRLLGPKSRTSKKRPTLKLGLCPKTDFKNRF